jgi:hypothetical protein
MAGPEHVRISFTEGIYGQRNLLHSQLELLDSMKKLKAYKKLRREEFALKMGLKIKVEEAIGFLDKLNRALPRTKYIAEEEEPRGKKKKSVEPSLQEEIDLVKRKLIRLQSGY